MAPPLEHRLKSSDGTEIFWREWTAPSPHAALLIVHGYADHSGRYLHVADFFAAKGIAVAAIDLRGHGQSGGARGHVLRFDDYFKDVDAVLAPWRKKYPDIPHAIFGHSMGGLTVLSYALARQPDVKAILATSPFLGVALKVPAWKASLGRVMSKIYPGLALPSGLNPDHLSHDPEICRAYREDPLVFKTATARWFTEAMGAIDRLFSKAGEFKLPCMILQAEDDRLADPKRSKPLFDSLGSSDKKYVSYPGMFHEIMNEPGKARVLGEIYGWLESRLKSK